MAVLRKKSVRDEFVGENLRETLDCSHWHTRGMLPTCAWRIVISPMIPQDFPSCYYSSMRNLNFPVAIDSDRLIWQAFDNKYWPAQFFIDGKGRIRYHHFGEGDYGELERVIQKLLIESGAVDIDTQIINVSGHGVEAAPSNDVRSPETYLGYRLTQHFASPQRLAQDSRRTYDLPARLALNQ